MRASIKWEAKCRFRAQYWPCVGVQAVLFVIPIVLSWMTGDLSRLRLMLTDYQAAANYESSTLLPLLTGLLTGTISMEASYFYLRVFRGERVSMRDFFTGLVTDVGKKAGAYLWMGLFLILWAMLAMIPSIIFFAVAMPDTVSVELALTGGVIVMNSGNALVWIIWLFVLVAGFVLAIIKALSYHMMYYLIRDCPRVTVRQSMRLSIVLMKGNKGKLFVLTLSFLGWILLTVITLGVLGVFFAGSYMAATTAGFYHHIKRNGLEGGVITKAELGDTE